MSDLQSTLDAIDQLAVHQCSWCSTAIADDGASSDFCDDQCQSSWISRKQEIIELVGYNEPTDLPQHYSNQRELSNPETTPRRQLQIHILRRPLCTCTMCSHPAARPVEVGGEQVVRIEPDIERFRQAMRRVGQSVADFAGMPVALLVWPPRQQQPTPAETFADEIDQLSDASAAAGRRLSGDIADWFSSYIDADVARRQLGLPARSEYRDELQETPQERALRIRRTRNTGPQPRTRAPRRIDARRTR